MDLGCLWLWHSWVAGSITWGLSLALAQSMSLHCLPVTTPKIHGQRYMLWRRPRYISTSPYSGRNIHCTFYLPSTLRNGFPLPSEFEKSVSAALIGPKPLLEEFIGIHWYYFAALGPACSCYIDLIYCVQMVQLTQIYRPQDYVTCTEHAQSLLRFYHWSTSDGYKEISVGEGTMEPVITCTASFQRVKCTCPSKHHLCASREIRLKQVKVCRTSCSLWATSSPHIGISALSLQSPVDLLPPPLFPVKDLELPSSGKTPCFQHCLLDITTK